MYQIINYYSSGFSSICAICAIFCYEAFQKPFYTQNILQPLYEIQREIGLWCLLFEYENCAAVRRFHFMYEFPWDNSRGRLPFIKSSILYVINAFYCHFTKFQFNNNFMVFSCILYGTTLLRSSSPWQHVTKNPTKK